MNCMHEIDRTELVQVEGGLSYAAYAALFMLLYIGGMYYV